MYIPTSPLLGGLTLPNTERPTKPSVSTQRCYTLVQSRISQLKKKRNKASAVSDEQGEIECKNQIYYLECIIDEFRLLFRKHSTNFDYENYFGITMPQQQGNKNK